MDSSEEDAFVFQMLRLGARWWTSWNFYEKHYRANDEVAYGYHYSPNLHVGYSSSGGAWVLKSSNQYFPLPGDAPRDWSKASMAFTMDERCAALKSLGAIFYEHVE